MAIVTPIKLESVACNVDFSGGDISSDAGCLLLSELIVKLSVKEALQKHLLSHPLRTYDDADLTLMKTVLVALGYHAQDDATSLRDDPVLTHCLGELASQETMSRRMSNMGGTDVRALASALDTINASAQRAMGPKDVRVIDIDTTLLATYGEQDRSCFNFHYQDVGYHPILATVTSEREIAGFELRSGSQYCSKGAGQFAGRVLDRQKAYHPNAVLALRGDAGFAAPEVFEAAEVRGALYAIRLKENSRLYALCAHAADQLTPGVSKTIRGWFLYQASLWSHPRRVCYECKIPEGQLLISYTFIVTNILAWSSSQVLDFYRKRGEMEQIIGELKGFLQGLTPYKSYEANQFSCLIGVLAYSLINWLRLLCIRGEYSFARAQTIVHVFIKIAAKKDTHSRQVYFRLPSSYPKKRDFLSILGRLKELPTMAA